MMIWDLQNYYSDGNRNDAGTKEEVIRERGVDKEALR